MGQDLWRDSVAARQVFDVADEVLGYKLSEICFEGPEDRLRDTEYAQPAIFTASLASLAAAVEAGRVTARPAFMAGHSLGEYSALVAAGAMSLEDGLALLNERARRMAEAGRMSRARSPPSSASMRPAVQRDLCRRGRRHLQPEPPDPDRDRRRTRQCREGNGPGQGTRRLPGHRAQRQCSLPQPPDEARQATAWQRRSRLHRFKAPVVPVVANATVTLLDRPSVYAERAGGADRQSRALA